MIVHLFERAFRLMKRVPIDGSFVEFGVYRGKSLLATMKMAKKVLDKKDDFYGFDSFQGMPKSRVKLRDKLKSEWARGTFSNTGLTYVKNRLEKEGFNPVLIKGQFSKLRPLSKYGIKKIRFAHIDADIYEGYKDALMAMTPYIQTGTVILFDEFIAPSDWGYQDIKNHGERAIREWEKKSGINLHLIRFKWTSGLCVIVSKAYLKKHGRFLETLRNDNLLQTLMDILHQIAYRLNI